MRRLLRRPLTAARLKSIKPAFSDSYSPNTHKAYSRAVESFATFLKGRAADDDTVAAFLTAEAERGLAPASLSILAAAIGAAASSAGARDPRGPVTRRTLRRLKRKHAARGRGQVEGLKREAAVAAARLAAAEGNTLGLRDAALLLLGSDGLLRISELAAVQVEDLGPGEKGSGVLALPRSKTDQEGEGANLYVCRETMEAVAAWLRISGITEGPLFRSVLRNGVGESRLSTSAVRSTIQRRARAAGVTGRVSGHSLRVGSAQSLVAAGASTAELMQAGRWTDERTATRYAANELAANGAVARYFEDEDT
ncbi:MAG: tyrosine-type recombinase/integrase [Acidobacteria bacterium]|nr:tyrosine-type recombinase/integrase [Acidobacteriota bacterium]